MAGEADDEIASLEEFRQILAESSLGTPEVRRMRCIGVAVNRAELIDSIMQLWRALDDGSKAACRAELGGWWALLADYLDTLALDWPERPV